MYTKDFLIRHRQLAESADKVIGLSKRVYNSQNVKLSYNGIDMTSAISLGSLITIHYYKPTKLLQSKSKQPRLVYVTIIENKRYYEEK